MFRFSRVVVAAVSILLLANNAVARAIIDGRSLCDIDDLKRFYVHQDTNNRHYIYVAGRDKAGEYIIGDPDRKNVDHFQPVKPAHLVDMMSGRDGFVAGWK